MKLTKGQMSDSLLLGCILASAGGFLDAYTYTARGHVFAYGQTGNILLFGINLAHLQPLSALRYFLPVAAFTLGILLADHIRYRTKNQMPLHWRQITVALEIITLLVVAFLPEQVNLFANATVSFVCGIQVESFRKVEGHAYATTMTTGNLRSATEALYQYLATRDPAMGRKCGYYYSIMGSFILGAVIGSFVTEVMQLRAVLVCCIILAVCMALMAVPTDSKSRP